MNDFYKFFNYNWIKIIKKNIKNNKQLKLENKQKEELSNLIIKKEIISILLTITNFLITYTSLKEIYKISYKNFILFRIIKDNIFTSVLWFTILTILPFITLLLIRKTIKTKYYLIISISYIISNIINLLMIIYFITSFINTKILGLLGILIIILNIINNSKIIIKINENYLTK